MIDVIYVKVGHSTCAVELDSILYMEKQNRRIIIHRSSGECISFYGKFDSVMPFLDGRFVKPHQSYIINMQQIFRLGVQEVVLFGGDKITLGRKTFSKLRRAFDEYITESIRNRPKLR